MARRIKKRFEYPLCFFVPAYNEESSLPNIEQNIEKALNVFPNSRFYFSDNCSTDGTRSGLFKLRDKFGENRINLYMQKSNIGFSKNMLALERIPENSMVAVLGANDTLFTPGLIHLGSELEKLPDLDMVMCNWAYYKETTPGKKEPFWEGDVETPFEADTLDDFFSKHMFPPHGIMQYVCKREKLLKMRPYSEANFMSPQLGAFFDSFPCKFKAIGSPPLALVRHLEEEGWRSSANRILETHFSQAQETIIHLKRSHDSNRLSFYQFNRIGREFATIQVKLAFQLLRESWGAWQGGVLEKYRLSIKIIAGSYTMGRMHDFFGPTLFFVFLTKLILIHILSIILPHSGFTSVRALYQQMKLMIKNVTGFLKSFSPAK